MDKIHHRHRRRQQHPWKSNRNSVPRLSLQYDASLSRSRRSWVAKGSKLQLIKVVLLITLCSSLVPGGVTRRAHKHHGKHFVIHVPMKIRSHHHTHTVFTQLQGVGKGVVGGGGVGGIDGGKGTKQTIYKIMGYSTHHTSAGAGGGGGGGGGGAGGGGGGVGGSSGAYGRGYGHGHGYAHTYRQGHRNGGVGGYGEINYDDYSNTDCDNSLAHGDMIFNHYSRQDEEYPDVEELIEEDERERDEWE